VSVDGRVTRTGRRVLVIPATGDGDRLRRPGLRAFGRLPRVDSHAGRAGARPEVVAGGDLGPGMVLDHSPDRRGRNRPTVLGS
jgi:hypothetical protein